MLKIIIRLIIYISLYCVIEFCLKHNYTAEAWATLIIGIEAAFIGLSQLRNTRDDLEIKLFLDFNERYSRMNEKLRECDGKNYADLKKEAEDLKKEEKHNTEKNLITYIEDYINLCCEEYYCYNVKQQIPFRIWSSWHRGIMYNWENYLCLREYWEEEKPDKNKNSYYYTKGEHPFRQEAGKRNKWESFFDFFEEKIGKIFY